MYIHISASASGALFSCFSNVAFSRPHAFFCASRSLWLCCLALADSPYTQIYERIIYVCRAYTCCVCVRMCACACSFLSASSCLVPSWLFFSIYAHIHTYIHVPRSYSECCEGTQRHRHRDTYMCACVCARVCVYVYTHTDTHTYSRRLIDMQY